MLSFSLLHFAHHRASEKSNPHVANLNGYTLFLRDTYRMYKITKYALIYQDIELNFS